MNDHISGTQQGQSSGSRLAQQKSSLDCNFASPQKALTKKSLNGNSSVGNTSANANEAKSGAVSATIQPKAATSDPSSSTGLSDPLKAGLENLSGYSMQDVKVHYNSDKPAQMQAHAYAQGTDIHIGPGQEKHLPHEAWHVVQQMQGRVRPTLQIKGNVQVNDDAGLEQEADIMGKRAIQLSTARESSALNKPVQKNSIQRVVQRQVLRVRKGDNQGKWYDDRDPDTFFETEEEARQYQRILTDESQTELAKEKEQKKQKRIKLRRKAFKKGFPNYVAPESSTARLYKNKDQEYDDVPVTKLGPDNAKDFMNMKFEERKASLFKTQVINLGGFHHVIAPGTDIGLTPAEKRPDLTNDQGFIPLSREGQAKPYDVLSQGLDKIAKRLSRLHKMDITKTRKRMGKDLDRLTRGNPTCTTFSYNRKEKEMLNEVAAVLRLDKGRVPKATKYIRSTFIEGKYSFRELLRDKYYVGAGTGGVAKLREQAFDGGESSDGSDIEEVKKRKREGDLKEPEPIKKRKLEDE